MQPVLAVLIAELERPRPLLKQVTDHLCSHHALSRDGVGAFLANELGRLEDYEIDLIFSPMFTPMLVDQARFAEVLEHTSVPAEAWPELIRQLAARPTICPISTEDGQSYPVTLREVTIERYVKRLHLDTTVPDSLLRLLNSLPPVTDRPLLKALARRPIWHSETRRQILFRFLLATTSNDTYQQDDLVRLLRWMETYQPADAAEILQRTPHWQEVLRKELSNAANPKPFFSERVKELHGEGRDHRSQDNIAIREKKADLAFLDKLQSVLLS